MRIVAISDVHCRQKSVTIPDCDLLISAGDYSFLGTEKEVRDFHEWLEVQPAKNIISMQGNHEKGVEKNFALSKLIANQACPRAHFVDEGLIEIEGVKIWLSAVTPFFHNWAWNRYPGEDIQAHWDKIPQCDIIVTHGPCHGILDVIPKFLPKLGEMGVENVGCPQLLKKVLEVKPRFHICGHIHENYGIRVKDGITFINASICDRNYNPTNTPILFGIQPTSTQI